MIWVEVTVPKTNNTLLASPCLTEQQQHLVLYLNSVPGDRRPLLITRDKWVTDFSGLLLTPVLDT